MSNSKKEVREIFLKYTGETSDKLFLYLRRRFHLVEMDNSFLGFENKFLKINEKPYFIKNNKKNLVNKIYSLIQSDWESIDVSILRRTIKKYIDFISIQ